MSDKRISQLVEREDIANNDVLPIVALGASTTNKVTISTIQDWMQTHLDTGVTSVGITLNSSGTDVSISNSPITSSGNITLSIPTASATNRGVLSSTDWTTFNNKQNALGYTPVPNTRTLTINSTTYDLTSDRAWSVGTVTSVGLTSSAAALTITNSPITTNGNIGINFAGTSTQYVAGDGSLVTFPTISNEAQGLITEVYNETGATLTKGTIVYINGGHGNLPTITKALASGDSTSAQTYGVVQSDITNNNNGYVVVVGRLTDIDTQAYTGGTQLYLSGSTAGAWTSTKPYAPIHLVYVGIVVRSHPTQGIVEVKIQNGYELDELHNVSAQSPSNNDGIFYNTSTSLWEKKSIGTALGYTPLSGTGTTNYISKFTGSTSLGNSLLFDNGTQIGINTITPSYTFDVYGTIGTTSTIYANGGGGGIVMIGTGTGATSYIVQNFNSNILFLGDQATATKGISIDVSTGNIGMGTSSPSYKLDVSGTGRFTGQLTLGSTITNGTYTYTLPSATGTFALTSDLSDYVTLSTTQTITAAKTFSNSLIAASSALFNNGVLLKDGASSTASGHFAISSLNSYTLGFASSSGRGADLIMPSTGQSYTLPNASGTIALTSDIPSVTNFVTLNTMQTITGTKVYTSLQYYDNGVYLKEGTGTSETGYTSLGAGTNQLKVGVQGAIHTMTFPTAANYTYTLPSASGTIALTSSLSSYVPTSRTLTINGTTYDLSADRSWTISGGVSGSGTTNYVTKWTSSSAIGNSIIYDSGSNVGIGTASPNSYTGYTSLTLNNATFGGLIDFNNNGVRVATIYNDASSFILGPTTGFLTLLGGGSERMRISSSGNVGIGTTAPISLLNIYGSTHLQLQNATTGATSNDGTRITLSGNDLQIINRENANAIFYTNDTERMRITSTGNVGIGTTSPVGLLQLNGAIANSADAATFTIKQPSTSYNNGIYIERSGERTGYFMYVSSNADALTFRRNWVGTQSDVMVLTRDGNVGIGTTTPQAGYKLDVKGIVQFGNDTYSNVIRLGDLDTDSTYIQSVSTSGTAKNLVFYNNAERMRINTSGNVLIGISSSAYKLDVTSADAYTTRFNSTAAQGGFTAWANSGTAYGYAGNAYHIVVGGSVGDMALTSVSNLVFASGSGLTERMRITSGGNVEFNWGGGFKTIMNANNQINAYYNGNGNALYLNYGGNGSIYAGSSLTLLYSGSDRRIKTDINDVQSTINKILNLKPRTFKYKEKPEFITYGFIAQEVEEIMPELVRTSEGISMCNGEEIENQKSVESYSLIWASILVKAIQEQQSTIQELEARLKTLENK